MAQSATKCKSTGLHGSIWGRCSACAPWKPHLSLPYKQRKIAFAALPRARSRELCISVRSGSRAGCGETSKGFTFSRIESASGGARLCLGCHADGPRMPRYEEHLDFPYQNHKISRLAASLLGWKGFFFLKMNLGTRKSRQTFEISKFFPLSFSGAVLRILRRQKIPPVFRIANQ